MTKIANTEISQPTQRRHATPGHHRSEQVVTLLRNQRSPLPECAASRKEQKDEITAINERLQELPGDIKMYTDRMQAIDDRYEQVCDGHIRDVPWEEQLKDLCRLIDPEAKGGGRPH